MNFSDLGGDTPASSSLFSSPSSGGMDSQFGGGAGLASPGSINAQDSAELQDFLAMEQEKARMRSQVQAMTDLCWDKCMGQPSSKFDSKTEACLDNCAQRFVDVSLLITQRFATMLQRQANM